MFLKKIVYGLLYTQIYFLCWGATPLTELWDFSSSQLFENISKSTQPLLGEKAESSEKHETIAFPEKLDIPYQLKKKLYKPPHYDPLLKKIKEYTDQKQWCPLAELEPFKKTTSIIETIMEFVLKVRLNIRFDEKMEKIMILEGPNLRETPKRNVFLAIFDIIDNPENRKMVFGELVYRIYDLGYNFQSIAIFRGFVYAVRAACCPEKEGFLYRINHFVAFLESEGWNGTPMLGVMPGVV